MQRALKYALVTLVRLRRRRKKPDTGTRYRNLAMASLLAAAVLHFVPLERLHIPADALPLLTGVLVIVGCAMSAVLGEAPARGPVPAGGLAAAGARYGQCGAAVFTPAPSVKQNDRA